MRLFLRELQKLFFDKTLFIYIIGLMLVNLLLLFMQSYGETIDYRALGEDLSGKSPEEQLLFMNEAVERAQAISNIEHAMMMATYNTQESERLLQGEYKEDFEKYGDVYESGDYLRYTENIYDEYLFVIGANNELTEVVGYEEFLEDLQKRAEMLSAVSIFAQEGGYSQNNIKITAAAFADMSGTKINYFPQHGIFTALNHYATDVILIFIMILVSFTAVRQERDNGCLSLIRAMPAGRFKTALAKLFAVSVVLFLSVLTLYLMNLVFCEVVYGLGDLSRTIQSVPYLMRSTLKVNLFEYIGLYFLTKWAAAIVLGAWILFSMLIAKHLVIGVFLSVIMPLLHFIVRELIPATHSLNVIKYANLISLLQTDEILGNYRNLYWFNNMPIQLNIVAAVSGVLFFSVFAALFLYTFTKKSLLGTLTLRLPKIFTSTKIKPTTVKRTEWYKLMVLNGGAVIMVCAVGFQIYTAVTLGNYLSPEEVFYRHHMQSIAGVYDEESNAYMLEQLEKFESMRSDTPNDPVATQMQNYALEVEHKAFQRTEQSVMRVNMTFGAHVVYETGYNKLFGFNDLDLNLNELMFASVALILMLSGFMVMERISGMNKVITAMPLGRRHTIKLKLHTTYIVSAVVAVISLVPRFVQVSRDYGFSGLFSPANSLIQYQGMFFLVPIIAIIALMIVARVLACVAISSAVLFVSSKAPSYIIAVMISALILLLPPVLAFMGLDVLKYLSTYLLFDIANNLTSMANIFVAVLYSATACLAVWRLRVMLWK